MKWKKSMLFLVGLVASIGLVACSSPQKESHSSSESSISSASSIPSVSSSSSSSSSSTIPIPEYSQITVEEVQSMSPKDFVNKYKNKKIELDATLIWAGKPADSSIKVLQFYAGKGVNQGFFKDSHGLEFDALNTIDWQGSQKVFTDPAGLYQTMLDSHQYPVAHIKALVDSISDDGSVLLKTVTGQIIGSGHQDTPIATFGGETVSDK